MLDLAPDATIGIAAKGFSSRLPSVFQTLSVTARYNMM